MEVKKLFSEPLSIFEYPESLDSLRDLILKTSKQVKKNNGNYNSDNKEILSLPELKTLKDWIDQCVLEYHRTIIGTDLTLANPYITQSWINYTNLGDYHHIHSHSNSIVSGVFYINAQYELDKIVFHKNNYRQIDVVPKVVTEYNSDVWAIPVNTGVLLLFPSYLMHEVPVTSGDYTRISIAFNTFIEGTIGNNDSLTLLQLSTPKEKN